MSVRESSVVSSARPAARQNRTRADTVTVNAVDIARQAAVESGGPDAVGEPLGYDVEGDRLVTHYFECLMPGYVGWRWSVTLVRASRAKAVTVDECLLLPGSNAVLAPEWVPWDERIKPDDLGPGDLLPVAPGDTRLIPGYTGSGDIDELEVVDELGLGRPWVMSPDGRADAAERWYEGDGGPDTDIAKSAPAPCRTCAFAVPLAGSLGASFGVCANERTPFDGTVVSWDHGCGGHSDVRLPAPSDDAPEPVVDTLSYELVPLQDH